MNEPDKSHESQRRLQQFINAGRFMMLVAGEKKATIGVLCSGCAPDVLGGMYGQLCKAMDELADVLTDPMPEDSRSAFWDAVYESRERPSQTANFNGRIVRRETR